MPWQEFWQCSKLRRVVVTSFSSPSLLFRHSFSVSVVWLWEHNTIPFSRESHHLTRSKREEGRTREKKTVFPSRFSGGGRRRQVCLCLSRRSFVRCRCFRAAAHLHAGNPSHFVPPSSRIQLLACLCASDHFLTCCRSLLPVYAQPKSDSASLQQLLI